MTTRENILYTLTYNRTPRAVSLMLIFLGLFMALCIAAVAAAAAIALLG